MGRASADRFDVSVLGDAAGTHTTSTTSRSSSTCAARFGTCCRGAVRATSRWACTGRPLPRRRRGLRAAPTSCTPRSSPTGTRPTPRAAQARGTASSSSLTVWETIPLAARLPTAGRAATGERVLAATDLFLPATERARDGAAARGRPGRADRGLLPGHRHRALRGAGAAAPPRRARDPVARPARLGEGPPGRDARARGAAPRPRAPRRAPRSAAADRRRRPRGGAAARATPTSWARRARRVPGGVPYDEMPAVYAQASCMVLASLPSAACSRYLGDLPRASGRSSSGWCSPRRWRRACRSSPATRGAIPEVVGERGVVLLARRAGSSWRGARRGSARTPRRGHAWSIRGALVERYSTTAAAERLAAAYERVLAAG